VSKNSVLLVGSLGGHHLQHLYIGRRLPPPPDRETWLDQLSSMRRVGTFDYMAPLSANGLHVQRHTVKAQASCQE